jgi:large subunit ribosomal protein L21
LGFFYFIGLSQNALAPVLSPVLTRSGELMYAIVEISGKQFKMSESSKVYLPLQTAAPDSELTFDRVLLVSSDKSVKVGKPTVKGAKVEAKVVKHVKGDKVVVFHKKRRKRYKVLRGHRQWYTQVEVQSVNAG